MPLDARAALERLREGNRPFAGNLRSLVHDALRVVGAEYDLETGIVRFLDGAPL